ncbi:RraA family protein [Actinomadura sp. KC216]|uniref:RraA family protein n=1 Tax=Actinomadura sp. KC216 TaxID=2530370 RepID=UPI001042B7E6|nr:RraA family protein [Actinomadura sp. KC216]TDB91096.1 RraA family protein [Actinomadura sp. KC216]
MTTSKVPGAASIHEAGGGIGALPGRLRPVTPRMRVHGPAYPVRCPGGDNLWLHRAIAAAPPGSVMVAETGGLTEFGYWGEIMTRAARAKGLAGLVIDGGVRDTAVLASLDFPVFSSGARIRGTGKDPARGGALAVPVVLGDVLVRPGDLVVGDADGVVIVPADAAVEAVEAARRRDLDEAAIIERLEAGETTLDIYGLPA